MYNFIVTATGAARQGEVNVKICGIHCYCNTKEIHDIHGLHVHLWTLDGWNDPGQRMPGCYLYMFA